MIQAISYHQNFAFIVILYRIWSKVACVIFTLGALHSTIPQYSFRLKQQHRILNPLTFNTFQHL
jgi:hypothetical protein